MQWRIVLLVLLLCGSCLREAHAQSNDDWNARTVIAALPFNATETVLGSSGMSAGDPDPACRYGSGSAIVGTSWYGYTTGPATEYVNIAMGGSTFGGFLAIYTGAPGAFRIVSGGCGWRGIGFGPNGRLFGIRLAPNTAYSILIARPTADTGVTFAMSTAPQLLVTKTADTRDGSCDAADCSLREAIDAANASAAAVIVPAGTYLLTRTGSLEDGNDTGDLDLAVPMGVYGAGMASTRVSAGGGDRLFDLSPDAQERGRAYAIADLTLANGSVSAGFSNNGNGGAMRMASFFEFVGVERVAFTNSSASSGGGGLSTRSAATIRDCVATGNFAVFGGGISVSSNSDVKFEISGTTASGNQGQLGGGFIVQGDVRMTGCTASGNSASSGGGGISHQSGPFVLAGSTLADNNSPFGGGVQFDSSTPAQLRNNLLARNSGGDCAGNTPSLRSYNLIQSDACGPAGTGDIVGVDAGLSPALADNGGPTRTYALLAGSAALDAGNPAGCTDASGIALANDQRGPGFPRVVNGRCDIGALESPTVFPPGIPVLDPASDSGGFNNDGVTNDTTPRYTGTCVASSTVAVRVDGAPVAPSVPCTVGAFDWTPAAAIADGDHAITAVTTGPGGTSLASPPAAVRIDTQAPAGPVITGPATAPSATFTVTGTIAEGAAIVVLEGVVQACATSTVAAGPWQCDATVTGTGAHVLRSYAFDAAGNSGPIGPNFTVTLPEDLFANGFE